MICESTQRLVPCYMDGELDLVRTIEMESHFKYCTACAEELQSQRALRSAMVRRQVLIAFAAPVVLRDRIRVSVRTSKRPEVQKSRIKRPSLVIFQRIGAVAILVLSSLSGWQMTLRLRAPSHDQRIVAEVLSSHVRSLEANHLVDVASADQHTVKPWFDANLDFSPPVKDLASNGFPLVGGRLDYLENREVAALIYRRREHFINVFVWPTSTGSSSVRPSESRRGYNVVAWSHDGFQCWAVSDIGGSELAEFIRLLQRYNSSES